MIIVSIFTQICVYAFLVTNNSWNTKRDKWYGLTSSHINIPFQKYEEIAVVVPKIRALNTRGMYPLAFLAYLLQ